MATGSQEGGGSAFGFSTLRIVIAGVLGGIAVFLGATRLGNLGLIDSMPASSLAVSRRVQPCRFSRMSHGGFADADLRAGEVLMVFSPRSATGSRECLFVFVFYTGIESQSNVIGFFCSHRIPRPLLRRSHV